jgi:clan AA aspartic protease
MILGLVNNYREAVIGLIVRRPTGQEQEIEAVIDTGFNGSLSLPPALIAQLGLQFRRRGRAILADGSDIIFDIYEATVIWDGQPRRVAVDEADTDPLVGMGLLHGYELTIEVVKDGGVTIKRAGDRQMEDQKELYERLNILDSKCSGLLQLSSVILALNVIPAVGGKLTGFSQVLSILVAVLFLVTSLLSLYVLQIEWQPTSKTLQRRTMAYRISLVLTVIGLFCVAALIIFGEPS